MSLIFDPMRPQGWDETLLEQGRYREWFYAGLDPDVAASLRSKENRNVTYYCRVCKKRLPKAVFNLDQGSSSHSHRCNRCTLDSQIMGAPARWENDSPLTWQDNSNCRTADPEIFFPENEFVANSPDAPWRQYCTDCPVLAECLDFGKKSDSVGVFGGQFTRYKNQPPSVKLKQATRGRPRKVTA